MLKIFNFLKSSKQVAISKAEDQKRIMEQDKKNRDHVGKIIDGHYEGILPAQRILIKTKFLNWQMVQKKMFQEASKERLKLRAWCVEEKGFYRFKPFFSSVLPNRSTKIFIKDVFTEPFPSSHDMQDWALETQVADIMILQGITPDESTRFYVHQKNHFVNHKMVRGIIQFDIYDLSV